MEPTTHVERVIRILEWLSSGKTLTVAEAWRRYGQDSSRRTVQRDFTAIEEAGIPLDVHRNERKENEYSFPTWYRKMVLPVIESHELTAFHFLKNYLRTFHGTRIGSDIRTLEEKLEILAPGTVLSLAKDEFMQDRNFGHIDYSPFHGIIDSLIQAITTRAWVNIRYHSLTDDKIRSYTVFIHKLFIFNAVLYAVVYFPAHKDTLSLAAHRILEIIPDPRTDTPPEFNEEEFTRTRFGVYTGPPEDIILHIHPDFTRWIQHRRWHPTQKIKPHDGGWMEMRMTVPISPDLITWIMGWHHGIRVKSPVSLRETVKKNLLLALEYYPS